MAEGIEDKAEERKAEKQIYREGGMLWFPSPMKGEKKSALHISSRKEETTAEKRKRGSDGGYQPFFYRKCTSHSLPIFPKEDS